MSEPSPPTLERARLWWQCGEWKRLAELQIGAEADSSDGQRIAHLVASARRKNEVDPGRSDNLQERHPSDGHGVLDDQTQIAIGDIYNSMACVYALLDDHEVARMHFAKSARCIGQCDEDVVASRMVREMARLGLFQSARNYVDSKFGRLLTEVSSETTAHLRNEISVARTELDMFRQELSKFHRGQSKTQAELDTKGVSRSEVDSKSLRNRSVSQLGQDLWVIEKTNSKRDGFFVEFGAADGISLSNTYLLETALEWSGLCVEPNPKFFEALKQNRRCVVSSACIAGKSGEEVDFILADVFGGMEKSASMDHLSETRVAYQALGERVSVRTISLDDFLQKHNAPKQIDYISVDTEGSEWEILEAFPFRKWDVQYWTIEHNFTEQRQKIRHLMERNGYSCEEHEWDDWYYKS